MTVKEAIKVILEEADEPLEPREIAGRAEKNYNSVRGELRTLFKAGEVLALNNQSYCLPGQFPEVIEQIGVQPHEGKEIRRGGSKEEVDVESSQQDLVSYPYYTEGVGAGPAREPSEHPREELTTSRRQLQSYVRHVPDPDDAFWTRVDGESMEPWLPDGTIALVKVCTRVNDEGRYVLWFGDDEGDVVRRVERLGGGVLRVTKDNPTSGNKEQLFEHKEDDLYTTDGGRTVRIRVQGRVIFPADTAHSILNTVTEQLSKVLNR